MKTKLFNALKQKFSKTGLSDEVLQAHADSLASTGLVTDDNLSTVVDAQETALKKIQSTLDQERTAKTNLQKQFDDYQKANPGKEGKPEKVELDDIDTRIAAAVEKHLKPIVDKQSESEAKSKSEARRSMIISKAKALNISQTRIEEGFYISDDLDESGIDAYLSKVAQNDVARSLPKQNEGFGISTSENLLNEIAAESVMSLPDVKP